MKNIIKYSLIILIAIIVILILDYNCPFFNILGIPCAGCGITRSFIALLHLDFQAVKLHNASIYIYIFITIIFIMKTKYYKQIIGVAILFILIYYFIRLYRYYPNTYPMLMNDDTIIYRIIDYFNLK